LSEIDGPFIHVHGGAPLRELDAPKQTPRVASSFAVSRQAGADFGTGNVSPELFRSVSNAHKVRNGEMT
jgi:hypothetical protein